MQEPEKSGRCEPKLTLPSLRAVNFVEFYLMVSVN